ncbi:MAG TPA: sulfur carrier protein ThiS [Bryobacteraceae bacterium]|nr:sulfur carrier protein ThiS [Bryobacteraceae bacterium]
MQNKSVNPRMLIEIVLNGEPRTAPQGQTVLGLLEQLRLDPSRVAVELNRRIVKQPHWADTVLQPGAEVEVVQFVGGG